MDSTLPRPRFGVVSAPEASTDMAIGRNRLVRIVGIFVGIGHAGLENEVPVSLRVPPHVVADAVITPGSRAALNCR